MEYDNNNYIFHIKINCMYLNHGNYFSQRIEYFFIISYPPTVSHAFFAVPISILTPISTYPHSAPPFGVGAIKVAWYQSHKTKIWLDVDEKNPRCFTGIIVTTYLYCISHYFHCFVQKLLIIDLFSMNDLFSIQTVLFQFNR